MLLNQKNDYTMRILTTLLTLVLLLSVGQMHAQSSKKERKAELKHWKKEVKKYKKNPLALKKIMDKYEQYKDENKELQDQVNSFETERGQDLRKISQLEQEVARLNNSLMDAEENARQLSMKQEEMADKGLMMGLVYRVQIGAYSERSLSTDLDTTEDMDLEEADGMQKILVGQFRELTKAEELQDYMKTIGVSDAWVVPYKDGVRLTMEEAQNF
jgi:predicted RNase H-like nuclease (RuvC/YqgF family)